jgi:hypothetical protein
VDISVELIESCMRTISPILKEVTHTLSENELIAIIRRCNYDSNAVIEFILQKNETRTSQNENVPSKSDYTPLISFIFNFTNKTTIELIFDNQIKKRERVSE